MTDVMDVREFVVIWMGKEIYRGIGMYGLAKFTYECKEKGLKPDYSVYCDGVFWGSNDGENNNPLP